MKAKQTFYIDTISDGIDAAEMVKNKEFKGYEVNPYILRCEIVVIYSYFNKAVNYHKQTPFFCMDIAFPFVYNFHYKVLIDTDNYCWSAK